MIPRAFTKCGCLRQIQNLTKDIDTFSLLELLLYSMPNIKDLTVAQLKLAIEIREQIENLQAQLASIGGVRIGRPPGSKKAKPGKRRMSAAGRARIAAAAKARWAKFRSGAKAAKPTKKKRFNAAARAKLSAAAKARWAKAKASGKKAL
jgi:hypothetical protein